MVFEYNKGIKLNFAFISLILLGKLLFSVACVLTGITSVSAQHLYAIQSSYLEKPDSVLVFTPSDLTRSYPILYMLGGYSWNHRTFAEFINLDSAAEAMEMIIVCPDGQFDSWYIDDPSDSGRHFESFFIRDLIPKIESSYRVDQRKRGIMGVSMGGHGAVRFFLKYPDLFWACGSTSGVMDLSASKTRDKILAHMFGPYAENRLTFYHFSNINEALIQQNAESIRPFLLDIGKDDYLFDTNVFFADLCRKHRVNVNFIIGKGGHHPSYWKKSVPKQLEFFKSIIE